MELAIQDAGMKSTAGGDDDIGAILTGGALRVQVWSITYCRDEI